MDTFRKKIESIDYGSYLSRLLGSFFFIVLMISFFSNNNITLLNYSASVNLWFMGFGVLVLFVFLTMLHNTLESNIVDAYVLFIFSLCYFVYYLAQYSYPYTKDMSLVIVFSIFMVFINIYLLKGDKLRLSKFFLSKKATIICVVSLAFISFFMIAYFSVLDYKSYYLSTYDVGIFGQMYHYLTKSFIPFTTCERDVLLSHFAVHMSPIYYVLIPFYVIFPSIITLQILQPLIVMLGVIPLYLICKNHKMSNKTIVLLTFLYCFIPSMSGACSYAFHENLFLPPLMLWLIYLFEKKSKFLFVPLILCLLVKEDATIYVCCICLYFFFNKKQYLYSLIGILIGVLYFFASSSIIASMGDGIMSDRLNNFMLNDSLFSIIKVIFTNPGYFFSQLLAKDKFNFFIMMLFPLLFVPLLTKNIWRFILLIPFILINLMPSYLYQYSIYFQYVFGSSTLLIYLVVLNIEELPEKNIFKLSLFTTCLFAYVACIYPIVYSSHINYKYGKDVYKIIDTELTKIDMSKTIVAQTFILPHLCNADNLYDLDYPYAKTYQADYVVFDRRFDYCYTSYESYYNNCLNHHDYEILVDIDNVITILVRK